MKTLEKREQEPVTFEVLNYIEMLHVRGGDGDGGTTVISNPPPPPPPPLPPPPGGGG